ncbi:MAG: substrate-binding domain-containing protein, partial [Hungateiclostridium saccincola]|nr:substrate-binding domain-containing protein [Acetivibrio saccincola]
CCNDIEAITIIKGLSSMGIKIPEDISIIGFLTILNCQRTFHQN